MLTRIWPCCSGGTLLLDTVNLDTGAGRVTPRDEKMATILMKSSPPLGQAEYFDYCLRIPTLNMLTGKLQMFKILFTLNAGLPE